MTGAEFQEIMLPVAGQEIYDYMAYAIFFFSLIGIMVGGDEDVMVTLFMGAGLIGALINKTYLFGYMFGPEGGTIQQIVQYHDQGIWYATLSRALMFSLPLIAIVQSKSKWVRLCAILVTLLALSYTVGKWWAYFDGTLLD